MTISGIIAAMKLHEIATDRDQRGKAPIPWIIGTIRFLFVRS